MSKFLLLTACCLLASINFGEANEDLKAHLMTSAQECMAEVGGTEADITDILNNAPAAGLQGRCLHACIMKKFGLMDSNGKFAKPNALEFAKEYAGHDAELLGKANKVIEHCAAIHVNDNACDAVEDYKNCIREKAIELNIADMEF